jgi:cupin 2 domain-containing protein
MSVERGTMRSASSAPASGEETVILSDGGAWRVEQILSGSLPTPVEDLLDHDEWVVVLEGGAELEVDGEREVLGQGDWVRLCPGVPHRVLSATPGTSWLAVHIGGSSAQDVP